MALATGLKIKMGFITRCVPNTIIYLRFVVQSFRCIVTLMKKKRFILTRTSISNLINIHARENILLLRLKLARFGSACAPFFQRRGAAVQSRKVQRLLPRRQSLPRAQSGRARLVTRRSVAAGRIMRGLSHGSFGARWCSPSYPSHTHPHVGKAKVTRSGRPWEMMFGAKAEGGTRPGPRTTLLAVKVMRYVCSCGKTLACDAEAQPHFSVFFSPPLYLSLGTELQGTERLKFTPAK